MWLVLEVELHEDDILVGATKRFLRLVLLLLFAALLCIFLDGLVVRQNSICLLIVLFFTFAFLLIIVNCVAVARVLEMIVRLVFLVFVFVKRSTPVGIPLVLLASIALKGFAPVIVKELCNGDFIIIVLQELDHESIIVFVDRKVLSLTITGLKELGHRNIILIDKLIYSLIIENEV